MLAAHVPAAACHRAVPVLWSGLASVRGGAHWGDGNLRRWLNAQLHCLHLRYDTVMAHAVTMTRAGQAVALVGGHGAGKSVVGLALAALGWQVAGGDLTLIRLSGCSAPVVVGGTRAYLVPAGALGYFFPELPLPSSPHEKIDYRGWLPVTSTPQSPLRDAVLVDVAERGCGCAQERLDGQTSATVWYRATGHALDRLLGSEVDTDPLRLLESAELARHRVRLTRALAMWLPLRRMRGDPQAIAEAITRRAQRAERGIR
jgi:hypothetical protein